MVRGRKTSKILGIGALALTLGVGYVCRDFIEEQYRLWNFDSDPYINANRLVELRSERVIPELIDRIGNGDEEVFEPYEGPIILPPFMHNLYELREMARDDVEREIERLKHEDKDYGKYNDLLDAFDCENVGRCKSEREVELGL